MQLLLGTKNQGKIREIKSFLETPLAEVELLTYEDRPFLSVLEEGSSLAENARLKARQICEETGLPVLAEDSGLEVTALDGRPGTHSSRFAGDEATDEERIAKLLQLLLGVGDRSARFRTVAILRFPEGKELMAEGELQGEIALSPQGESGFGYDPIFIPQGFSKTLAELGPKIKNRISHRRRALERLLELLREHLRASDRALGGGASAPG